MNHCNRHVHWMFERRREWILKFKRTYMLEGRVRGKAFVNYFYMGQYALDPFKVKIENHLWIIFKPRLLVRRHPLVTFVQLPLNYSSRHDTIVLETPFCEAIFYRKSYKYILGQGMTLSRWHPTLVKIECCIVEKVSNL